MARGDRGDGQRPQQQPQTQQQPTTTPGAQAAHDRRRDRHDKHARQSALRSAGQQPKGAQKDRDTLPTLSEGQTGALKMLLAQVPELAASLRAAQGADRTAIGARLAIVAAADEAVAQVFAARLGEARGLVAPDASEIAQALGALDARHTVAREARRASNRLRGAGANPTLTIPAPAPQTFVLPGQSGAPSVVTGARPVHLHPVGAHEHDGGEEDEEDEEDDQDDDDDDFDEFDAEDESAVDDALSDAASQEMLFTRDLRTAQFVEAHVTRTRESGGVSLALVWQEGADPNRVRGYLLDLDFWRDGVHGCVISEPMSRGAFQREVVDKMRNNEKVAPAKATWAQARRLVQEALGVNAWRKVEPATEFKRRRTLFDARLLHEPEDDEQRAAIADEDARVAREGDRPFVAPNLEADETLANWLGAWSFGDYAFAYDLLAADTAIRRGASRAEYIAQRRQWADEAKAGALRLTLIREQERRASALWTPGSAGGVNVSGRKEVEAFWSLVVTDSPLGGQFDEVPMGTLISKDTGRHWYWTAYTMQRDRSSAEWVITALRDEGAASQGLTVEELQKRITDAHATAERIAAEAPQAPEQTLANNRQAAEAVRSVTGALTSSMHYSDALVVKLPLDESAYRAAIQDARTLGSHERAAALLERMQGRFADDVQTRFELGIEQYLTAEQYGQQGQAVGANGWLDRAIATMTQVVADEPTAQHLQGLGELLARQGHFSQAEARMREAVALDDTNATLHADLAEAIMGRFGGEDLDQTTEPTDDERKALARQALTALRDASKRDSSLPRLFTRMGAIYEALGQHDDAIITFQEAIRRDPTDDTAYYSLGTLFLSRRQADQALPLLQMATQHEPTSVQYRLSLASCYALLNQNREATQQLDLIDRLQPGLPQVAELRAILARQTKK